MSSLRFAANLSFMFAEAGDIFSRYSAARAVGFRAVESAFPLDVDVEQLVALQLQEGLQQEIPRTVVTDWLRCRIERMRSGRRWKPRWHSARLSTAPGSEGDRFKENNIAPLYNCMHVMAGLTRRDAATTAIYERNIRHAVDRLAGERVMALIEPISPQALPGYFLDNFQYAVDLVKRVASPYLRLQLDLFHLQNMCGNITNNLTNLLPYTGHIQIAQPPHRHEPGIPGELDFGYILPLLVQLGYTGYVGLEYRPSTECTADSLRWISQLGHTL